MKNFLCVICCLLFGLISISVRANTELVIDDSERSAYLQLAAVSFSDKPPEKKIKKDRSRSIKPIPVQPKYVEQYDVEGYINQQYVRLVLEVADHKTVVGNMFDQSGRSVYVHGEYYNGALHVYDTNGTHFTIVVE